MTLLLIIMLFSLGLFHWSYESAIAPSLRSGARYKLFRIRDATRNLAATKGIVLNHAAINLLEESTNSAIEHMRSFDFGFMWAFRKRFNSDESFRRRVNHRVAVIEDYRDPDFIEARERFESVVKDITLINSGGWFIYVIPIALAAICWDKLREMILKISVVSDQDAVTLSDPRLDELCEFVQ